MMTQKKREISTGKSKQIVAEARRKTNCKLAPIFPISADFKAVSHRLVSDKIENSVCQTCKGLGYVQDFKNKAVHTCWKCLQEGKLCQ